MPTTSGTWNVWCQSRSTANSTSGTWQQWAIVSSITSTANIATGIPRCLTEAEQRLDAEVRAKREAEARQREAGRAEANRKARLLLMENLTAEQKVELETNRFFTVPSKDGQRIYRIHEGRVRNIRLLGPDGKILRTYCAHPIKNVPDADTMLSQMLMLRHCEEDFLRIANVS